MIIHKSVTVARSPDVAFKIFAEEMTSWWPLDKYSFLGPDATLTIEPHAGGKFVERTPDGREYVIGEVLRYEPGVRLTCTWTHENGAGVTEVDIRFTAVPEGTRVDVAHSGFETLPAADQMFAGYGAGWDEILGVFAGYADAK